MYNKTCRNTPASVIMSRSMEKGLTLQRIFLSISRNHGAGADCLRSAIMVLVKAWMQG
jgi:hypothetical protein